MRVLHLTESFWPRLGGLETLVQALAAAQYEAGHAVAVLVNRPTQSPPPPGFPPGIAIHSTGFIHRVVSQDPAALGEIARHVTAVKQAFQPDLIHLHADGYIPWLHLLTLGAVRVPCVATLHTPQSHIALPPPLLRRMLHAADRVVAVSDATRREWCDWQPGLDEKSSTILNGLAPPAASPQPLRFDPATLLCLGRLDTTKGFDVALHALALLAPRWPAAHLVIAGDGPVRAELEQLTDRLGLRSRVTFRGRVERDAVAAEINAASLVLMPSRWAEPFGLVAVEAMQLGRPLIASRAGGLPEIVRDGETGCLVPPDDPAALAAAIESLLAQPDTAARLGAAARARALSEFTLERCVAEYDRLYRTLAPVASS